MRRWSALGGAATAAARSDASPTELRERYFVAGRRRRGRWRRRCARLVEFRRHNLVLDPAPAARRRAVRPDRLPQRADLLRRRDGGAGDRLARARARAARDAGAGRRRPALRLGPAAVAAATRPAAGSAAAGPRLRRGRSAVRSAGRGEAPIAGARARRGAEGRQRAATSSAPWRSPTAARTRTCSTRDAYFVRGLTELGHRRREAAVASLRRALYVDPTFGLAAFQLGARARAAEATAAAAARAL